MNCINCYTKFKYPKKSFFFLICKECSAKYLVVESIPIMVNDESDFYRYRRKLNRLVQMKNEKS